MPSMKSGDDHHLRAIRRVYAEQTAHLRDAVIRYFPRRTKVTRPAGGYIVWVEMPETVDAYELYEKALTKGISIAPGTLFTSDDHFKNHVRLNAAFWSEQARAAVEIVGGLACEMA